jgi:hypothetical protein
LSWSIVCVAELRVLPQELATRRTDLRALNVPYELAIKRSGVLVGGPISGAGESETGPDPGLGKNGSWQLGPRPIKLITWTELAS